MKWALCSLACLSLIISTAAADCTDGGAPGYFSVLGDLSKLTVDCPPNFSNEDQVDCTFHLLRVTKALDSEKYRQQKEGMRVEIEVAERGYKNINEQEFNTICAIFLQDSDLEVLARKKGVADVVPTNVLQLRQQLRSACKGQNVKGLEQTLSKYRNSPLEKEKFADVCGKSKESREKFRKELEAQIQSNPHPEYSKRDRRLLDVLSVCDSNDFAKVRKSMFEMLEVAEERECESNNFIFSLPFRRVGGKVNIWRNTATYNDRDCGQVFAELTCERVDDNYSSWQVRFGQGGPGCEKSSDKKLVVYSSGKDLTHRHGVQWRDCVGLQSTTFFAHRPLWEHGIMDEVFK